MFCFAAYFTFLSEKLPNNAGPDETAHIKATAFIYTHNRLPVYAIDKDQIYYSIFGATRSFRPPLVYIVAASTRDFIDIADLTVKRPYRKANALFGGLCALFLFLALTTYLGQIKLPLLVTTGFMLMPQVSFIFSYLNADGAAIMACSLILFSVTLVIKKGINAQNLIIFGISCGVLSLCKLTAWVFCFPVCLYALWHILKNSNAWINSLAIIFISFAITAGWRIGFNVFHHGIENPFNWQLDKLINQIHARIDLNEVINYHSLDKSYLDLLGNYDNFLSRTFLSFVGQLDWLRIRVGPLQYYFYGFFIVASLIACMVSIKNGFTRKSENPVERNFELSIVAGFALLFFMYMQFNINNDIQTQGKYVLPAFVGLLLLLSSWACHIYSSHLKKYSGTIKSNWIFALCLSAVFYLHAQALYKYVLPFYYSNVYFNTPAESFTSIPITAQSIENLEDLVVLEQIGSAVEFKAISYDPRLTFQDVNINLKTDFILIKAHILNSKSDYYQFYWDPGTGMSEQTTVKGYLSKGEHTIYQVLPVSSIAHLRFDLGTPNSKFTLFDLSFGPVQFPTYIRVLNRLFFVNSLEATHLN